MEKITKVAERAYDTTTILVAIIAVNIISIALFTFFYIIYLNYFQ